MVINWSIYNSRMVSERLEVYKTQDLLSDMGSRKRTRTKPQRRRNTVDGRCPKCTTIVRFNVSGAVGDEQYECTGCMSKYHVDDL